MIQQSHFGVYIQRKKQDIRKMSALPCFAAKSCLTLCTPWTAARQAPLSFTISRSLLKLMSIVSDASL